MGEKCARCGVGTVVKHPFCCERARWVPYLLSSLALVFTGGGHFAVSNKTWLD